MYSRAQNFTVSPVKEIALAAFLLVFKVVCNKISPARIYDKFHKIEFATIIVIV